ncbi:hypothetical protein [Anatilimnocola floriformis]|uniref:hypothetical protein n=1 Tax=Anatilimnocola floriformis TaxID=2948575 RepID=UPI0020C528FF|nr:hypothetical protein [Anatilimnocola floriformis]
MIRRFALLCSVLLLALVSANVAQAQFPYGGDVAAWNGWGGYGGGGGWGYLGTRVGFVPQPPYYAIHPPVYYSAQIIRRPYGYSPYAYPPTYPQFGQQMIESRSSAASDPTVFINPYAQPNGGGQLPPPRVGPAAGDNSSVQPQMIINPYVIRREVAAR